MESVHTFLLDVHLDDGTSVRKEISSITLMFFDTVVAELACTCGDFEYFEYEDEDGDRIAIRSDDDMSAFVSLLTKKQCASVWLVKNAPAMLDDIPAILPADLKRLNLISHGQFGSVYRSIHIPTDQELAVKCVSMEEYGEQRDNVFRELALMKKCSSCDFVVALLGAYTDSTMLYICLEYMDAGALDQYGPIPSNVLVFVSRSVFEGLLYLWNNKIIHRVEFSSFCFSSLKRIGYSASDLDLKPSNILVNTSGYVKLCDFGLSKVMEHSVTRSYVGTTRYMAPERVRGGVYRIESDIWSFGLTLWELAEGVFPLPTVNDDSITLSLPYLSDQRIPTERISGHPQAFQMLINRCLQHDMLLRWKVNDLIDCSYLKDGHPIDRCAISNFITQKCLFNQLQCR
ncbi:hypothetical protein Q1695_010662 [Nippostrongylus brasiliensis]|nr:hypothetical protein Q1695_010662 [Nippostrongylus brasiliensis]